MFLKPLFAYLMTLGNITMGFFYRNYIFVFELELLFIGIVLWEFFFLIVVLFIFTGILLTLFYRSYTCIYYRNNAVFFIYFFLSISPQVRWEFH